MMSSTQAQSAAVLKKPDGASRVGFDASQTVAEKIASMDAAAATNSTKINTIKAASYAEIRANFVAGVHAAGDLIIVHTSGIAGIFEVKAGTVTDDGGVLITDGGALYAQRRIEDGVVKVSWFGAVSGADISTQLAAAITYAKANGWLAIDLNLATWSPSQVMPQLNNAFNAVRFFSSLERGSAGTVTHASSVFDYVGGSGAIFGVGWRNVKISKSAGYLFTVKGFGGLQWDNCRFDVDGFALLSNDIGPGTFTEFVQIRNSHISCTRLFKMERGAGNDSFHGCGFDENTVIDQKNTSTVPLIEAGVVADGTNRVVWYNAPLNGQLFARSNQPFFKNGNDAAALNIFTTKGNLSIENMGNTASLFQGNKLLQHAGNMPIFGELTGGLGNIQFIDTCQTFVSGKAAGGTRRSRRYKGTKNPDGSSGLLTTIRDAGHGTLAIVTCSATNFDYCQLVFFAGQISGGISPTATVVATVRSFNSAGFGVPNFTVAGADNSYLQVNNSGWGAAAVTVKVEQLPGAIDWADF